jgi:hypothetical protein
MSEQRWQREMIRLHFIGSEGTTMNRPPWAYCQARAVGKTGRCSEEWYA